MKEINVPGDNVQAALVRLFEHYGWHAVILAFDDAQNEAIHADPPDPEKIATLKASGLLRDDWESPAR
jgi:hypothetical protein